MDVEFVWDKMGDHRVADLTQSASSYSEPKPSGAAENFVAASDNNLSLVNTTVHSIAKYNRWRQNKGSC